MTTERRPAGPAARGLTDLHLYVIASLALAYVAAWWSFASPVPATGSASGPAAAPQAAAPQAAAPQAAVAPRGVAAPTATSRPIARVVRKQARRARRLRTRSS